ncbi:MAG: electron transport complex subunit RsxE [Nanoarchaeota archaeon]
MLKTFTDGIIKRNAIFVQLLGLCPSLAVTTSLENALGLGIATFFVLFFSSVTASLIKNIIPPDVRIPSFIVIIATFVTLSSMLMEAYFPVLHDNLGIYVPLIVVNCLVLGRVLSFSYKNTLSASSLDAFGTGIGFMGGLAIIGIIREIIGTGQISLLGVNIFNIPLNGMQIMILPPGALLTIGLLLALFNYAGRWRQ